MPLEIPIIFISTTTADDTIYITRLQIRLRLTSEFKNELEDFNPENINEHCLDLTYNPSFKFVLHFLTNFNSSTVLLLRQFFAVSSIQL